MFRFEHPEFLYALALLPLLLLLYILAQRSSRKVLERLGSAELIERLMPDASPARHHFKIALILLGLAFLIVGWSNPQWGTRRESVTRKGIDVFLALDISKSMLAEDIAPNRLERAKKFGEQLIQSLKGDQVGLIFFAGSPFLQMPLSSDYGAATLLVRSANTDQTPNQGTSLGDAIRLAQKTFDPEKRNHQALIIVSDGETHDADARSAAEEAGSEGMIILTIGVGTETGSRIPVSVGGRPDYLRDNQGQFVETKLEEGALRDIAAAGNGTFFYLDRGDEIIASLRQRIDQIERMEYEQRIFDQYESYFQYFIGAGLLILFVEFLFSYRGSARAKKRNLFSEQS
ncbi:MAG: VWA domain-containing protein [Saprospiraceae bacterium]|nr:VWA domain-containing protein [Saprospiraceae bacterium]